MVPDADYRIKLPAFEGPLDLLLFLIRKNEIDIYDIPIEAVTRQYIDALHSMQQLDIDVAGEFFVMAATLMEIKSRMLLPRGLAASDPNAEEDDMDPRWELVHQLLQYKKFKEAATKLDELATFQRDMLARYVSQLAATESERPLKNVDRIELWNAFNIVLRRLAEKLVVGEIKDEQVTVADKMEELLLWTKDRKSFVFTELFPGRVTVRILVATFLAVLELTRLKKLRVRQDEAFADIIVTVVDDAPPAPAPAAEATDASTAPAGANALNEAAPSAPATAPIAVAVAITLASEPILEPAPAVDLPTSDLPAPPPPRASGPTPDDLADESDDEDTPFDDDALPPGRPLAILPTVIGSTAEAEPPATSAAELPTTQTPPPAPPTDEPPPPVQPAG